MSWSAAAFLAGCECSSLHSAWEIIKSLTDARAQGDLDRILNSEQPSYGTIEQSGGIPPRDEEELRREREALEHITAEAAEYVLAVKDLCVTLLIARIVI